MSAKLRVDLNCDMGEGFGSDEELCGLVTSVNIACGGHAGDARSMEQSVELATANALAIGAHPSLVDRMGFGRKELLVGPADLEWQIAGQVRDLWEIASAHGARLSHVKLHGALYSMAARDAELASVVVRALQEASDCRTMYALAGTLLVLVARKASFLVAEEAFADRAYRADGSLVPRGSPGAMVEDPAAAAARAVRMVTEGAVAAADGTLLSVHVDTICIHGDEPGAVARARSLREAFRSAGIAVKRFDAP